MKNISLMKITLLVVVAAFTSNFVSANNIDTQPTSKITNTSKFTQLLNQFDQDKNGLLSQEEVITKTNLHRAFNDIDTNNDSNINETELNEFLASNKNKKLLISKVSTKI